MAADEPSGTRPAPVVLRIKLRHDDVDSLVARFAGNVGKSGVFLPTKSLQPLGAEVKFELRLTTDEAVLVGLGRVKAVTPPDPANPRATFGMALELMRVTPQGKAVILRMLERRKQLGLPEVAVPLAADVDAARRAEAETGPRETPLAVTPPPDRDSHPVLEAPLRVADAEPAPMAPRGAVAVAKSTAVVALAPEAPRRPRPAVHEVIERASGPVSFADADPPDLDDAAVPAVVARAHALAAGTLDPDLAALRDSGAAPFEITIEAASAELARQLGGVAVARDRSARWASPPPTTTAAAQVAPDEVAAPAPEVPAGPDAASAEAAPAEAAPVEAAPVEAALAAAVVEAAPEIGEVTPDQAVPVVPTDALDDLEVDAAPVLVPAQISDEVVRLDDADVEEVEHTQVGVMPDPEDLRAMFSARPDPQAERELERRLEAQLAEAEADDEDLGFAAATAAIAAAQAATSAGAEVIPVPTLLVLSVDAEVPAAEDFVIPLLGPAFVLPVGEPVADEIDDAEILAEADAGDADLLAGFAPESAEAEAEAVPYHEVPADLDRPRLDDTGELGMYDEPPMTLDADAFDSLDVGRDSVVELRAPATPAYVEAPLHLPSEAFGDGVEDLRDEATSFGTSELVASFAYAPTDYAKEPAAPRASATNVAARLDLSDEPAPERLSFDSATDALAGFDDEDAEGEDGNEAVIGAVLDERYGLTVGPDPSALYTTPIELLEEAVVEPSTPAGEFDLESALDALDVDLDDLSIPHAKTELPSMFRRRQLLDDDNDT